MLTLIAFLALGSAGDTPPAINLSESVLRFAYARFYGEDIYLVSQFDKVLYKVSRKTGKLLASYSRVGQGPGEWVRSSNVKVAGKRVYVADTAQHKVIVLDTDLNYVREMKGLTGDQFIVVDQHIFTAKYNRLKNTMIQHTDLNFKPIHDFGEPLKPESDYRVMQLGFIAHHQGLLYYMPYARFEIRVFEPSGKLVETILPPFWDPDLVKDCDLKNRKWRRGCKYGSISHFESDGQGHLYINVKFRKPDTWRAMRYHIENRTWEGGFPANWKLDVQTGQLYLLEENDDETLSLKPYQGFFKMYPK